MDICDRWGGLFQRIGNYFLFLLPFFTEVSFGLVMFRKDFPKVKTGLGLVKHSFIVLVKNIMKSLGDIFGLSSVGSDNFLERKYVKHFIFIKTILGEHEF